MRKLPSDRGSRKGPRKKRVPRAVPTLQPGDAQGPSSDRGAPTLRFLPHAEPFTPDEPAGPVPVAPTTSEVRARGGVDVPILGLKTVSEQNQRGSWRPHARRHAHQKNVVGLVLSGTVARMMLPLAPLLVTITRVAPSGGLDDDNLAGSQKYVRDAIAQVLGCDDGVKEKRVEWRVEQKKGPWGIEIRIEVKCG